MSWIERKHLEEALCKGSLVLEISPALLLNDDEHQLTPLISTIPTAHCREDVTVIIPTHRRIPVGLNRFLEQSTNVWVLQNGTVEQRFPSHENLTVSMVDWKGHGKTRSEAVQRVKTPYVFFSVDDAIPLGNCLQYLIEELETGNWDAVVARQIPMPTADLFTRDQLSKWTPHQATPYALSQCDHVGTLYRTQTLNEYPIPDVPIAEDAWWSKDKQIACVPKAVLVHSHPRHTIEVMRREFAIHRQLKQMESSKVSNHRLSISDVVLSGLSALPKYGVREAIRTTGQNLSRFAAHKL